MCFCGVWCGVVGGWPDFEAARSCVSHEGTIFSSGVRDRVGIRKY